jgi:uncharacterized protein DUF5681
VKQQDGNRPPARDGSGKFQPGESGNPAGRPRGSRNKVTTAYLELLDADGDAVLKKAVELAKSGDRVALRLCLDRLLPLRRDRVVEFSLPAIEKATDIATAMAAVIEAAAAGTISMEEARQFSLLLESQRRAIETSDLAVRIQFLEQSLSDDGDVQPSIGFRPGSVKPR